MTQQQEQKQKVSSSSFQKKRLSCLLLFALCSSMLLTRIDSFFVPARLATKKKNHHPAITTNMQWSTTSRRLQQQQQNMQCQLSAAASDDDNNGEDLEYIKRELTEYLEKRKEENADEAAKGMVGKTVGGTKGNVILEYVSGSPNKEGVIEEAPQIFDYDELTKYGYGYLVTPIMNAGGRNFIYEFMGMKTPPLPQRLKPKSAPKLVIDRTGESDKARYSGLKMGQVLDDDTMAKALEEAQKKAKEGQSLRPKLEEESYVAPFADKRNTGPQQTPLWTAEKLDEYGKSQGRAIAWARRAKMGEFVQDPDESLELSLPVQLYAIFAAGLVSFAFGRSTTPFLSQIVHVDNPSEIIDVLQIPALIVVLAALGSSLVSGIIFAPSKNRNLLLWTIKGFLGGPITIVQLRQLDTLITAQEAEDSAAGKKQ